MSSEVTETLRAFQEHETFCRESLAIRDKSGRTVPFELQPAQRKLRKVIQRCREQGRPVRIIVLKARQVMISTATAAEFFHEVPFKSGQKAVIVAHELKASKNIFGYYEQLRDNYVPFRGLISLPPEKTDAPAAGTITWQNGSSITVATAKNLKGGRSASMRFLHLSEYAFWPDARTLMTGLMQVVPDDPDTCVIIESTANGVGDDFHRRWKEATDPTSTSEWIALFFAWWEHPEYVRPINDRAAFQSSLTSEERDLQQKYNLKLEQLHWRRWAIKNKCGGSIESFHQEYPSCPEEAFLSTGRPRFHLQSLAKMPVREDSISGELQEIASGTKTSLRFLPQERGAMLLYKKPQENKRYAIGIDVAEGIDPSETGEDPDYSVACVLDADTGEQVAKVRGRIEPGPFGEYCAALGRYYNWAYLVPEANSAGLALIEELLRQDYPPPLIYHRKPQPDEKYADGKTAVLQYLGWKQSVVTRPQLLNTLDMAIREFDVFITDRGTLEECQSFVWKPNGKCEAQDGCHDDEVFAVALAVVGRATMPADKRLHGLKPKPDNQPTSGAIRTYGKRRSEDRRGDLIRF